jgi:hypothetical protein
VIVDAVPPASALPSASAASAAFTSSPTPSSSTTSDWHKVHAPKQERQLLSLLRELPQLNLDDPPDPQAAADIKLSHLLSHPATLELVKDLLARTHSPENIALWLDVQRFRTIENTEVRAAVADEIFHSYIATGAKYEVNLSSFMKDYVQSQQRIRQQQRSKRGAVRVTGLPLLQQLSLSLTSPYLPSLLCVCSSIVLSSAQIYKNRITLDLFDEVEVEIFRLMVSNHVDGVVQSAKFRLVSLLLQHPAYQLPSMTRQNNTRGEIGGNTEGIFAGGRAERTGAHGRPPVGLAVASPPLHLRHTSTHGHATLHPPTVTSAVAAPSPPSLVYLVSQPDPPRIR